MNSAREIMERESLYVFDLASPPFVRGVLVTICSGSSRDGGDDGGDGRRSAADAVIIPPSQLMDDP